MMDIIDFAAIAGSMGVLTVFAIYCINRLTNLLDSYRHKYGFDRTLESKLYKNDKDLNRAEQHFQKRVSK